MSNNRTTLETKVLSNWINNQTLAPKNGAYIENLDPAKNVLISQIPRSDERDVELAISAAVKATKGSWADFSTIERAELCEAIADGLEERIEELAWMESRDTGKPIHLARNVDIPRAIANFRFFAGAAKNDRLDFHPMPDALNYTLRRPIGVVALITPWNLPLYLLSWKTAPALVMGNTIIAKPSEMTPTTASVLAEVIAEAGAPPGVFNLVHGLGAEVGQALVDAKEVKAISFTGGTATGALVAKSAAPQFKKLSLELGGKNPTIVFADSDFERAVEGACRAGFLNQGQVCLCGSRILVERSIYDDFLDAFVTAVKKMPLGDPSALNTRLGALISLEHRQKVEEAIEIARGEGGRVLYGGNRPSLSKDFEQGAFLEPTVIVDLPASCRTSQEEIFGPVVTIHPFDTEEEALATANDVRYGLAASLWTNNLTRAHRFSAALETGMVWVNTWLHRDLRVPFGGIKDSGVGREGGRYSLEFFSESRNVCIYLGDPEGKGKQSTFARPKKKKEKLQKQTDVKALASSQLSLAKVEQVHFIENAPAPVGAYPHARQVGPLLFLSGVGPRDPKTNDVPGGPVVDAAGNPLDYDISAQTHAVIQNVRTILEGTQSSLSDVVDVTVFLINMERDFAAFNKIYAEYFSSIQPTRTTLAISALPTPIAIELKVVAKA